MVILVKRYGQLGNRLFLFAHLIANAVEHGYALANPSFNGYARFFHSTAENNFGSLPIQTMLSPNPRTERWLDRVLALVQRPRVFSVLERLRQALPAATLPHLLYLNDDKGYDLNTPHFQQLAHGQRAVLLHGWCFRDRPNLRKHAPLIRELFALVPTHQAAVSTLLQQVRQQVDVLIGVHIRRGDYATYHGGRYFYPDAVYLRLMRELQQQFAPATRVGFLIASDAPPAAPVFGELPVFFATGHFVEDLYALAGCDYIVGPPSSYSMWASFYGEVPLLHVEQAQQPVPLSHFSVYSDDE